MIVTDRFVFLHLHKSGGSFVNECIRRHVPGARQIGYHLPRCLIPADFAQLPVIGLVRNPWSYYVSWYSFQQRRPKPNALFRVVSDEGRLDFRGTIHNMLDLGRTTRADTLVGRPAGGLRDAGTESAGIRPGADPRQRPRLLLVSLRVHVRRRYEPTARRSDGRSAAGTAQALRGCSSASE